MTLSKVQKAYKEIRRVDQRLTRIHQERAELSREEDALVIRRIQMLAQLKALEAQEEAALVEGQQKGRAA